jgi:hypothetical protein
MRLSDWETRLAAMLAAPVQFDWDGCNCALFAADCVWAITGTDPATFYRGDDPGAQARRIGLIRSGRMEEAVTQALGPPLASVREAGRGDIALLRKGRHAGPDGLVAAPRDVVGVVGLDGIHVHLLLQQAPGSKSPGVTRVKLADCAMAWHV